MLMLVLIETIDQMAMENIARWYGRVEERGWSFLEMGIRF